MDWQVHWLEAEGDLAPWRERIAAEIEVARTAVAGVLPSFGLDILVERVTGAVIPEVGTAGRAYRPSLCGLTVDPLNPNFAASLDTGDIRRTIAHEVHHCRRFAGPGYGRTLGEAIVSEGLAGQFAGTLFAAPPSPGNAPWTTRLCGPIFRVRRNFVRPITITPAGSSEPAAVIRAGSDTPSVTGSSATGSPPTLSPMARPG